MKKLLFFLFTIVFIASCNNYEPFPITSTEYLTQKYEMEFVKTFGTPSPNQEWGFTETTNESLVKTRDTKALTRAEQSIQGDIRIIGEDLSVSSNSDWDFNDIVLDVKLGPNAIGILQAAGGTLPLRIRHGTFNKEIHELFKVPTSTMVNTGAGPTKEPVIIYFNTKIKNAKAAKEIKLEVFKNNEWIPLKADKGIPAAKLCVDPTFQIVPERTNIKTLYGEFKNWVTNPRIIWY